MIGQNPKAEVASFPSAEIGIKKISQFKEGRKKRKKKEERHL